ncbi:unnamed protein product [Ectocarpus sp. 4 AP-2014]
MVNVRRVKCARQGCSKSPSFGVAGTKKREFCRAHAQEEMVHVNSKKCAHQGCSKKPSFGVAGTKKREFCREHTNQGTVFLGSFALRAPLAGVSLTQHSSTVRGDDGGGGYGSNGICGRFSASRHRDQRAPGTHPTGSIVLSSNGRMELGSCGEQETSQRDAPVPTPRGQRAPENLVVVADSFASAPDSPPVEEESETTGATIKADDVLISSGVAVSDDLVGRVPCDEGRFDKRQHNGEGSASPSPAKRRKTGAGWDGSKRTRTAVDHDVIARDPDSQASATGGMKGAGPAQAKVEIKSEVDQEHNATVNPAGDWSETMRE